MSTEPNYPVEQMSPIESDRPIRLSRRDSEAFVAALLDPPKPSERLLETISLYRKRAGA